MIYVLNPIVGQVVVVSFVMHVSRLMLGRKVDSSVTQTGSNWCSSNVIGNKCGNNRNAVHVYVACSFACIQLECVTSCFITKEWDVNKYGCD
jgi:hypothetical protein